MPFADVMGNLGDAIAGVDRTGAFIKGQQARADLDETQAATDAAMALAKQRRVEAELNELEKAARDRIAATDPGVLADPTQVNIGDLILSKGGSDYSSAMEGRNRGQQYVDRDIVGSPEGTAIGDMIVTEDLRRASQDALAPAAAIATRRPRAPGAPVIVDDGEGGSIYVSPEDAPGRAPAARPAAPRAPQGPTTQQRNIDDLVARGVPEDLAVRVVYNEIRDPRSTYTQLYNALRRNFESDEEAQVQATSLVESLYGPGALEEAQEPLIQQEAAGTEDDPFDVVDDASYDALPSGAFFVDPDGNLRQKP